MPIDTRVQGDPDALRAAARWLRDGLGGAVRSAADDVHRARPDTERVWTGPAGDAFRARMLTGAAKSDELAADVEAAACCLDVHADDLAGAKAGMARARQLAADAGLPVENEVIADPGPQQAASAAPSPDGAAASQRYGFQVAAYDAARAEVERVRRTQEVATAVVQGYVSTFRNKPHLVATDFVNGMLGSAATQYRDAMQGEAKRFRMQAAQFRQDYLRAPGGSAHAQEITRAEQAAANAADDAAARAGGLVRSIASKAPVIGVGITAAGIGWDIQHGKPPGQAIVSGVAGGAAAFAVGALLAGPPGWVAAAAILTGVGVGLVADAAYDSWVPDDVKTGIDNGVRAVGSGIGDAWDAVFG